MPEGTARETMIYMGAVPFSALCADDQRRVPSLMAEIDDRLVGFIPSGSTMEVERHPITDDANYMMPMGGIDNGDRWRDEWRIEVDAWRSKLAMV